MKKSPFAILSTAHGARRFLAKDLLCANEDELDAKAKYK